MLFLENVFTLFCYNPMWFHSFIVNWSLDTEQLEILLFITNL